MKGTWWWNHMKTSHSIQSSSFKICQAVHMLLGEEMICKSKGSSWKQYLMPRQTRQELEPQDLGPAIPQLPYENWSRDTWSEKNLEEWPIKGENCFNLLEKKMMEGQRFALLLNFSETHKVTYFTCLPHQQLAHPLLQIQLCCQVVVGVAWALQL